MNRKKRILVILLSFSLIFQVGIRAQQPGPGGDINQQLLEAAQKGDKGAVGGLNAGADPNIKAQHGVTALKGAREMGYSEIVEVLKKARAKD